LDATGGIVVEARRRLRAYAKELGLDHELSLESLIDSHRHLRSLNTGHLKDWRATLDDARARGLAEGRQEALENEYISVERLKSMSVKDLCDFLSD